MQLPGCVYGCRALVAVVVLLGSAALAKADPVRVTSGGTSLLDLSEGPDMWFTFPVNGTDYMGRVFADEAGLSYTHGEIPPLVTGNEFDLSTQWDIFFAWAEPFGQPLHHWVGQFHFDAGTAPLSCTSTGDDSPITDCSAAAPFSFIGTLAGYSETGELLLRQNLSGVGQGVARFSSELDGRLIAYDFGFRPEAPAPVPEPATICLVAFGLAATARRAVRRAFTNRTGSRRDPERSNS
jgi:PEP-CTERM motif-containing protein